MRYKDKYKCPACDKVIFHRWYPKCEGCHADLPLELLYSPEEKEKLRAAQRKAESRAIRLNGSVTIGILGACWVVGSVLVWQDPHDWKVTILTCLAITAWIGGKRWAAYRDDGLNPQIRKKEPNQPSEPTAPSGRGSS